MIRKTVSFVLCILLAFSACAVSYAEEIDYDAEYSEEDTFGITNILLLGVDLLATDKEKNGRSDCMMICSLDKDNGVMKLVSIERAIYVNIPDVGKETLTNAHHYGGPELVQQLVEEYFGIDLAGYVEIAYDGFIDIVDALGGIDIELTKLEALGLNGNLNELYPENDALVWKRVSEGWNHLQGHDTLMYCRMRAIDSDWHRIERQRNTIQALVDKTKTASLGQIVGMIKGVLNNTITNLPAREICALIACAGRFKGTTAEQLTVPIHSNPIVCDYAAESVRLHDFIYGPPQN